MAKVKLITAADGTIDGWQDDPDGQEIDTSTIVMGVSRLVDGKITTDQEKAEAFTAPQPTAEQQMIAALGLQVADLQKQLAAEKGGDAS